MKAQTWGAMLLCSIVFFLPPSATPSIAQSLMLDALKGHSIIVDYRELVESRRRGTFRWHWRDRIYVSDKGRIFHRFDAIGDRRNSLYEMVGDETGGTEDNRTKFTWDGSSFVRQWTRRSNGLAIRQTIHVFRTGSGLGCQMNVQRLGGRGRVTIEGSSCNVVTGNVFAGA
jgi:hypothetical protein